MKLTVHKKLHKGFTLIELLVVIAVLGVLALVVMTAINPADKIAAGNDARVQNDISAIANALQAYGTANNSHYPTAAQGIAILDDATVAELKTVPSAPSGYTAYSYVPSPASCTFDGSGAGYCTDFVLTGQLKSAKYTSTPTQRYESSTGKMCQDDATPGCL